MKRILFLLLATLQTTFGGARHFTFLYEAPTAAPGSFELENYATSLWDKGRSTGIDFRHEIEIGITEHFQASIYIANWDYDQDKRTVHYDSASGEFIYNLTNPVTDIAGISLYEELAGGHHFFESETKLIAQKNLGPVILLYNFTLEVESAGEGLTEHEGEIQNAVGASYEITPRFSVGGELLHEVVLPQWRLAQAAHNLFLGPNISWRGNRWFTTVTALKQFNSADDEPDYQMRIIIGVTL